ncbi:hypothetical protein MRX96_005697 [Rhipicephalus microplus]
MEPENERAEESGAPQDSGNTEQTRAYTIHRARRRDSHRDAAVTDEEEEADEAAAPEEEARVEVGETGVTVDQSERNRSEGEREGERDDLCGAS